MSDRGKKRDRRERTNPFAGKTGSGSAPTLRELDAAIYGAINDAERDMLSVEADGSIQIGSFTLTATGLQVMGEASYDDWSNVGGILRRLDASIQWLIGDWMAYGETTWGQTYEAVAEATGYEVKTLHNYTWVAKNVQFSLRKENLSFGHHNLVAGMEPDLQSAWLEYAAAEGLSVAKLRGAIREGGTPEDYAQLLLAAGNIPNNPSRHPAPPPKDVTQVRNDLDYLVNSWNDLERFEGHAKDEAAERARRLIRLGQAVLRRMNGEE